MKLIDKDKALRLLEIKGYFIGDIFENKELKQACHKGMSIAYNTIYEMKEIPLPKKKNKKDIAILGETKEILNGRYEGWNDCIDEILGEEE